MVFLRGQLIAAATAVFVLSACQTDQLVTGSVSAPDARAIAFESIDGPPQPLFERLVAKYAAEAEARKLPIVSRTGPAAWRVRLYLAAHVEGKKATITWVGDVFDARLDRAFRISGEEPAGPARRNVWTQVDDALLSRIAAKSLDALIARIGGEPSAPAPTPEPSGGSVIAMTDPGT